jgi:phosphoribosyl-AMP cyclohydrolase
VSGAATPDVLGDAQDDWLEAVAWNEQGLVPALAQDATSGRALMLAWMNREALLTTLREGRAVYWSRSRKRLWRKGEESGHVQVVREIRLDCDGDSVLLLVDQQGDIACHTGRLSCFYRRLEGGRWHITDPVLRDPHDIYTPDPAAPAAGKNA